MPRPSRRQSIHQTMGGEDSHSTARLDSRRHIRRKSSSGHNQLAQPTYHDARNHDHPARISRLPFSLSCQNMHPRSLRQLLVASTIIFFCLFLYGKRLWSSPIAAVHDEWAKPSVPPQVPPSGDSPPASHPPTPADDKTATHTALQQTPYHWNEYPLCVQVSSSS